MYGKLELLSLNVCLAEAWPCHDNTDLLIGLLDGVVVARLAITRVIFEEKTAFFVTGVTVSDTHRAQGVGTAFILKAVKHIQRAAPDALGVFGEIDEPEAPETLQMTQFQQRISFWSKLDVQRIALPQSDIDY